MNLTAITLTLIYTNGARNQITMAAAPSNLLYYHSVTSISFRKFRMTHVS